MIATGKDGRARSRLSGTITDYTGQGVVLNQAGRQSVIPAQRVVKILTERGPQHVAADAMFDQGEFAKALDLYRAAVADENRLWVRRQILAQCVWCYRNLNQFETAGKTFLIILGSDPTTPHFSTIPLGWTPHPPTLPLEREASGWLADSSSSAANLLGASWLLSTPQRGAATTRLQQLTTDPDTRVAQLAEAQLWRSRIVTASAQDVRSWQAQIERMPVELRAGPYYTLGLALARQGDVDQAALAFLRVPILYPLNRDLAADALLAAGRELEKADRTQEALGLYRELIEHHATARSVTEAQGRLETLGRSP